ncbi:putative membrane protein YphA (DoxX/SURF4 family) [Arthrobacter sp. V1I9]|nr:putative membrane protein YphA (DoxX/SURF4 family) [Arthrobacter sp. V1I9]
MTRIAAGLLIFDMLGAMFLVHIPNGFFVANNGLELVLLLAALCLAFVLAGAGRNSLDNKLLAERDSRISVLA